MGHARKPGTLLAVLIVCAVFASLLQGCRRGRGGNRVVAAVSSGSTQRGGASHEVAEEDEAPDVSADGRFHFPPLDCAAQPADPYPAACHGRVVLASSFQGCVPADAFQEWSCLRLDRSARLCSSERAFQMTVLVERSDTELDCADQRIMHAAATRYPAIRFTRLESVARVAIRNCRIEHAGFAAVEILRDFRGAPTAAAGHQEIAIEGVSTEDTKFGVYVGSRTRGVTIVDSRFEASREVGIYIDADSRDVEIRRVEVQGTINREGIAIDSATHVTVEASSTQDNAGGGIRLYHNCGELRGTVCPIVRQQGASHNVLRGNRIADGVFVASRQGEQYPAGLCADLNGQAGAMRDVAQHNEIVGNTFVSPARWAALSIYDAPNVVRGNRFRALGGDDDACIGIHLSRRAYRGADQRSVSLADLRVEGNDLGSCSLQMSGVHRGELRIGANRDSSGDCRGLGCVR